MDLLVMHYSSIKLLHGKNIKLDSHYMPQSDYLMIVKNLETRLLIKTRYD